MPMSDPTHSVPPLCAVPVAPTESYYETHTAKIARLEAELESARREIDQLRLRLAEFEKDRKPDGPKVQSRYWTPHEHRRFLEALSKFGPKDVRAIASYVGSRNATQVRTHAQKYFLRVARERKNGSALQSARRRSMSESDLARMGCSVRTPPGSPNRANGERHNDKLLTRESCDDGHDEHKREDSPTSQNDVSMAERLDLMKEREERRPNGGGLGLGAMRVASASALPALARPVSPSASPRPSQYRTRDDDATDQCSSTGYGRGPKRDDEMRGTDGVLNGRSEQERVVSADTGMDTSGENLQSSGHSVEVGMPPLPQSANRSMTYISPTKPPPMKPPPMKPPIALEKVDTAGINLLSLVASERKLETESGLSG